MDSNSTSGCIPIVETAMNVERTTFFQRTFGDNKICVKIENKIFLLYTQKLAYYLTQYSLHCKKIRFFYTLVYIKCTKVHYKYKKKLQTFF